MFRISFLVEDRKLPDVLRSLSGKVHNMEPPQVVTLEDDDVAPPKTNGSSHVKRESGVARGRVDRLELPTGKFTPLQLKARLPSVGWKESSVTYALLQLQKLKRIRKVRNGLYEEI